MIYRAILVSLTRLLHCHALMAYDWGASLAGWLLSCHPLALEHLNITPVRACGSFKGTKIVFIVT